MRAIQLREPGGPEVLTEVDLPVPEITRPSEVLVQLKAAGVNPVDTKIRARGPFLAEPLPAVLGCDGAGVVAEVGAEVSRVKPGDRVWFCHGGLGGPHGNYAEYSLLHETLVQPMPKTLDFVQAAAAPLVLITAWEALFDRAGLCAGQTALIHAGAGGVGHVAIQLAKHAGARVATTVSGPEKAEFVHGLGAEHAINYRQEDVVDQIMDWTEGRGVDVALDTVGPEVFRATIPAMAVYGDLVSILDPGPDLVLTEARNRNLRLSLTLMLTPQLRSGMSTALAAQGAILRRCAELIDAGALRIHVAETLPLADAAEAHRRLEAGGAIGKRVLSLD